MKSEIIQFLRENIIGKTLLTSVAYKLENGCLEGVYNDKMTFSNLVITENGFKFNMKTVTQEFRDNPIGEDKYKPVAFNSKVCFYLDNGKVILEYQPTLWEIFPDTLEKRLSKDDYPPYITKEQ